ncbi:uncharacterized protein [Nicotiana sylvestris]|uniref:uncharacterized protein n=1 Tax=Nicotiana sylvestris TaxID=4096 RepID=UPI00388CB9B2
MSYDIKVWRVIKKGNLLIPPRKDENGQVILSTYPLDLDDYTDEQVIVITINAKAKHLLYNAFSGEEYEKIPSCETAKEMWDKLEVICEGTNKVKETRINLLVREYELFQMKDGESAETTFSRFSKILGDLKSFGRTIKSGEQIDSTRKEEIDAFKATVVEPEDEEENEGGEQDENIAMFSQVVTSMMRRNKNSRREESDPEEIENMCFMALEDDNNKESGECGFLGNRGINKEEEEEDQLGLMADEGTSEVRPLNCPKCYELQEFVNISLADIERVLNELRKILREKKEWVLNLEEYRKKNRKGKWYIDSVCSRHMTGDKQLFKIVSKLDGETVTFGDKSNGNVIGVGKVPLIPTCDVDEVYLVDELGYNLLNIGQLCDNDYEVHFEKHGWFIEDESGKVILSDEKIPFVPKFVNAGKDHQRDPHEGITTRRSQKNKSHVALISELEPKKVDEVLKDTHWIGAMKEELDQFERNKVWELVPRPSNSSIIGTKWVIKNKLNESGQVVRKKARLVTQGYSQQEGIDYNKTFAPVARLELIRILLACAAHKGFKLFQMDVKSAFLNDYISEEVYEKHPLGYANISFPNHVYKLTKALYGLKQAPHAGNLITQIYVDAIIFGSYNSILCEDFAHSMKGEFEMSMMGERTFFLGLQIKQSPKDIFISQTKYTKELIKKFGMENENSIGTPMSLTIIIDEDNNGKKVDETMYRGMIGSLLYLTTSLPDIMFSICKCARFQSAPKESHLTTIKRIIRYLIGTSNLGLWYDHSNNFTLKSFSDADFAGDKIDRKSTSGLLGNALVSCHSKKQNCVSLSTTEADVTTPVRPP